MPRYFFNVIDGVECRDNDGTVLADARTARQEGLRFVDALLSEERMRIDLGERWTLEVADEAGVTVLKLDIQN